MKLAFRPVSVLLVSLLMTGLFSQKTYSDTAARNVFSLKQTQVYQIRVIDLASGDQSSIGSGFQVSENGLLASNFHVVSAFVHKPELYKLEYLAFDGSRGDLTLLAIDVVHDLSLLQLDQFQNASFAFNKQKLAKGDKIYSMGNPLDLGMTVIEGNYNGLVKNSRYQKILFSGSLNAGMSGGPAVNVKGEVVGINVSKGREHISFLVPVNWLYKLIEKYDSKELESSFAKQIQKDLLNDQESFYSELLSREWAKESFMEMSLPTDLDLSLKCWGHSVDEKKNHYDAVHQHCQSRDEIFINNRLFTGTLTYDYEWMESERLNRFQFYNLMEKRFVHGVQRNASSSKDTGEYVCETEFVDIKGSAWRLSSCVRAYQKYFEIFDVLFAFASINEAHKGLVIKVSATGLSQKNAERLLEKMTSHIEWEH